MKASDFKGSWRNGYEANSDGLTVADLGEGVTLTISDVASEATGEKGLMKPVVYFSDSPKKWVTCLTTCICVEAMFGEDPKGWVGRGITLYWDDSIMFGRERKGGVRVIGAPGIRPQTVTVELPRKKPTRIKLINTGPAEPTGPDALALWLDDNALTEGDLDAYFAKSAPQAVPPSKGSADYRAAILAKADTEEGLAKIAAFVGERAATTNTNT